MEWEKGGRYEKGYGSLVCQPDGDWGGDIYFDDMKQMEKDFTRLMEFWKSVYLRKG